MLEERDAPPPKILACDDDEAALARAAVLLERNGMIVDQVSRGQDAIDRAMSGEYDVVMLDVVMPDLGGLECCRMIKGRVAARSGDEFLPVVMVTVRNSPDQRVEGLRIGADDYVGKPYDERELVARLGALVRLKRMHAQLATARAQLETLATHDELTGLHNYRYLRTRLADEFKRSKRYASPLGCVLFDVDRFKHVNDSYGHQVGDEVLRQLARRIEKAMREVDVVARYGGEEFLIILPETDGAGALVAAERLRKAVADQPFTVEEHRLEVTISAGSAHHPRDGIRDTDDLIRAADRALYKAKEAGRNRVRTPDDI